METYMIVLITLSSLIGLALIILAIYFLLCTYLCKFLSFPKTYDKEYAHNLDIEKGLIDLDMSYLKREPLNIKAEDSTLIKGDFSYNPNNKGIVIIAHGYTWNREGSLKYGKIFYKHGYSIYIYDERGHGESEFKYTTMGYNEAKDVRDIVKFFREKYGEEIVIGLHGESMGAASVMNSLKYDLDIDFVVDDCGYNSLEKLICYKLKSMRLPRIMLKGCNLILKRKYKYCFNDVIPIESVSKTKIPILIVHGKKDTMVPYYHAEEIYERNKDHSYLYSLEGVEHAKMFETDIDEYERVLIDFLKKVGLENGRNKN